MDNAPREYTEEDDLYIKKLEKENKELQEENKKLKRKPVMMDASTTTVSSYTANLFLGCRK